METKVKKTCVFGGPFFDGEKIYDEGIVLFDKGGIVSINDPRAVDMADELIDVQGSFIMPGLVDLHSDALEKCIEMRPGVFFDHKFAIQNLDRRLAASGITSFCHAISFGEGEMGLRSLKEADKLLRLVKDFSDSGRSCVRHYVHARYEIGTINSTDYVENLLDAGLLDMVSVMDHTPGQGQFRDLESFSNYYGKTYALTKQQLDTMVDRKRKRQAEGWAAICSLIEKVVDHGIPVMSHDDDTSEKIELLHRLGVTASEFPVTMEAASAAMKNNMKVFMGAPNMIRGISSNGHLTASETVKNRLCTGFISDYYPESLVQSPFVAEKQVGLDMSEAFRFVTSAPGEYLKPSGSAGRLKEGLPADIIIVTPSGDWAAVERTFVSGLCVYRAHH